MTIPREDIIDAMVHSITQLDFWQSKPVLEGFEQVIGRKLDCSVCVYFLEENLYSWKCKFYSPKRFNLHGLKPCKHVQFQQTILDEIKLRDKEIEDTKIDTHPRHLIGKITPSQSLDWFPPKNGKKQLGNYIMGRTVKLELIL